VTGTLRRKGRVVGGRIGEDLPIPREKNQEKTSLEDLKCHGASSNIIRALGETAPTRKGRGESIFSAARGDQSEYIAKDLEEVVDVPEITRPAGPSFVTPRTRPAWENGGHDLVLRQGGVGVERETAPQLLNNFAQTKKASCYKKCPQRPYGTIAQREGRRPL